MSVISINIHIDDLDAVLGLFDKIEVWRAPTISGTYTAITADKNSPALIDGNVSGPWAISGQTLTVVLNGADPVSIVFTGSNPLNLITVLQQINAVITNFALEVPTDTDKIRLTSPVIGTGSSIILSGSARSTLGFPSTKTNGRQARISLTSPTTEYLFRDFDGDPAFYYKTRYFSTTTQAVSSFSDPRQGNPQQVLLDAALVVGSIHLADTSGKPVIGRRIIFVPIMPMLVPSSVYGILPGFDRIIVQTDEAGNASVKLAIGMQVKVFFEGSAFNREFTVPDADFDILQVATAQPDTLNIVVAPPMPIRVS